MQRKNTILAAVLLICLLGAFQSASAGPDSLALSTDTVVPKVATPEVAPGGGGGGGTTCPIAYSVGISASATTVCPNGSATFSVTATNYTLNGGQANYSWYKNGTLAGSGSTSISIGSLTSGSKVYCVVNLDKTGCTQVSATSNTIPMSVYATPVLTAITGGPTTLCQGSTNEWYTTSSTDATSYTWTISPSSAGTFKGNVATDTLNLSSSFTGTATISVTGAICTLTSSPQTVTLNVTPLVSNITAPSGPTTFCQGLTPTFTTSASNATEYIWTLNGQVFTDQNSASMPIPFPANMTGTATVSVFAEGCDASSTPVMSTTVNIIPTVQPAQQPVGPTVLCQGNPAETYWTATTANCTGYNWTLTPSAAGTITGSGTYAVVNWDTSFNGTATLGVLTEGCNASTTPGITTVAISAPNSGVCAVASASSLNYVRVRNILKPGVADTATADGLGSPYDVAQTTTYFDGLGRSIQSVAKQASPLQNDMVTTVVLDYFGRQAQQYLPYTATTNDGNYKSTALADLETFNSAQFPGEQDYYAKTNYEASPASRVLNSYAPGESWVGSNVGVSAQYLLSTASDSVQIWSISSAQLSIPLDAGAYQPGQLYKSVTIDEAGHQVVEYKDKIGKAILKKVQLSASPSTGHAGWLCTYYVYDTLQRLRVIIQPQAVALINGSWSISQNIANELCFRYEYDGRSRLAIKKVPGAGQVWAVYDARDRIVMTQDSALHSNHQWMFVKYDLENRPDSSGLITDPANFNSLAYHDSLAYYSISYPTVGSYTNQLLTQTFYDDYSWVSTYGAPVSSSMATNYTGNSNYFITSYNTSPTYALPVTPFPITRGMATGEMRMVLGTTNKLYSVSFYDDRARIIQTQSVNYTGAIDTVTIQYNFDGLVLRNLLNHQKNNNTVQHHVVVTKMDYDQSFRLRHIWKNIDNAATDQLIDSLQYNELGQLSAKYLGNQVDSLIYSYNIRGWLTGINQNYVAGTTSHYFGMELGYNNTTSVAPGNTYLNPQLNGNIEGVVWKSAGSGINRKYDFTYDNANRLSSAAFLQNTSGTSWDKNLVDFSVSHLTYDNNGNILTMTQRGFTVGGSTVIDSLTYSYLNNDNSNKLMGVADAANNPTSTLADFHYNPATKQATDYNYDVNGNLIRDNNKNIDTIVYNCLNLPQSVHMKGEGYVAYTYDADGTKLSKVITDSVAKHSTTILYIAGFVYQQTDTITNAGGGIDSLQFIGHEEGRTRWAYHKYTTGSTAYRFEYDFFEKDHLGNTRTVLTQERDTTNYLASMEAAYRSTETQLFGNITTTSSAWNAVPGYQAIPSQTMFAYTNPNDSVSKVDSSSTGGQKTGPSLLLKVMSGDSVQIGVQCFYNSGTGGGTNNSSFNNVLSSLTSALASATAAGAEQGSSAFFSQPGSSVYTGLTSFLSSDDPVPANYPKAYINWIFLDDQFNYVSGLSGSVQAASSNYPAGQLNFVAPGSQLALNRNGYLYIWVSNETQGWDVFFDNLAVQYKQGPLLEENHYYPFGLTMAGISDKAIKTCYAENKFRYNDGTELQNKEFRDGSGLELYDAGFRRLDPQLGRFTQIDPLADQTHFFSTYSYVANNPIYFNDPSGLLQMNPQTMAEENLLMGRAADGGGSGGGGYTDDALEDAQSMTDANFDAGDALLSSMGGGTGLTSDEFTSWAEGVFNDASNQFGGQYFVNSSGDIHGYQFGSASGATDQGAVVAYQSGYLGSGSDAIAAYQAITGSTLIPVVSIGHPNSSGGWTTENEESLMSQLAKNGAYEMGNYLATKAVTGAIGIGINSMDLFALNTIEKGAEYSAAAAGVKSFNSAKAFLGYGKVVGNISRFGIGGANIALTLVDGFSNPNGFQAHNYIDLVTGGLSIAFPVFGLIYGAVDLGSQLFTHKSISEHIEDAIK